MEDHINSSLRNKAHLNRVCNITVEEKPRNIYLQKFILHSSCSPFFFLSFLSILFSLFYGCSGFYSCAWYNCSFGQFEERRRKEWGREKRALKRGRGQKACYYEFGAGRMGPSNGGEE